MIQTLAFTEMNQAVPGSLLSPRMEAHLECEVPSPSQWSDPCFTPPSFHSPVHYPSEIEKVKELFHSPVHNYTSEIEIVKEEPYSPPSDFNYLMSKETSSNEASTNIADLLAENGSFIARFQYGLESQACSLPQTIVSSPQESLPKFKQEDDQFDFLDTLVDLKEEIEDESRFAVTSTTPVVTSSASSSVPPIPSTVPIPTSVTSIGDGLRTVELMALHHCRQDVERVSQKLNISKDPTAWSVANVKSWLEFEADQHRLPALNLGFWNYSGLDLVGLTENHFRELIPQGGELLFAKLEYWRINIPSRSASQVIQYQNLPSPSQQPLSINVQPQQYFNVPQMYQSPTQVMSPMFSPNNMMLSPVGSQQQPPSPRITVPQQPTSPAPQNLPTPVIQVEREQQLKRQNIDRSKSDTIKRRRSKSPAYPISTSSFLEESCVDMTALLQQTSDVPKSQSPQPSTTSATSTTATATSTVGAERDDADSDEEVISEKPAPSSGGSGRGGTHIHLWQFLKELLQHPHKYAPCIRWLDRQAGIFKIEDSVRVAQLWGKRKNRPAMNYDKLSRSIRQYYKKGIMKKTERSQRLVYQFCHPYGL